jgi:hypothetical protein
VTYSFSEQTPHTIATNPEPPAAMPSEPIVEAAQVISLDIRVLPVAVEAPATPPPVVVTASPATTLTSRVGTGAMALTAILIVLMTGVWFYGNRLASHLTRRNDHA